MLNIVQHGDIFELRIDNQSFSHIYHMERTKRAFVYDNEGGTNGQETKDRNNNEEGEEGNNDQEKQEDSGYGGYKKGHPGVKDDWRTKTRAWSNNQRERNDEEEEAADQMWKKPRGN